MGETEQSVTTREVNIEFRGDGFEYFKIWIVNVLLTIITLGIYSAWAKVRSNRYFHSNMYLDDNNFRYLAEPLAILKGRIIAIVALIIYSIAFSVSPEAGIALTVALLFLIPYFINQSLAFNHRMSSYKNIQFRFKGSYGQAFMIIYVWPIIGMLTLGILYPLALLKANQYIVRNSSYGTSNFDFDATFKDFGIIFLIAIGILMVILIPFSIFSTTNPGVAAALTLPLLLVYLGVFIYFNVAVINLYYRSTTLLDHKFNASLSMAGFTKVLLINLLLTVLTLGLYMPAAKVRMTRYLADNIQFIAKGSLDNFAAAESDNISALGEEFGEVFDFGF
jgi:uncharacterized membrane protein YjgN (DUF898 family)